MPFSNKDSFFESVVENLRGDIAILDRQHRYVYVNPYAVKDAEIRQWLIGKTDLEYCLYRGLDSELAHRRRDKFKEAVESRGTVEWEERFVDSEGSNRVFLRRIYPIINTESNEVTYLIGHGLDITERRKIRDELETNRRFTEAVLNTSPNLIFVKDSRGRFLMVNKAVADLFNMTPLAIVQKSNDDVHNNEKELEEYANNDAQVIQSGKSLRIEESFTKPDGETVWYDTIKVPLVEADGSVNVLGISTDITERKRKEGLLKLSEQRLVEGQELTKSGNWIRHLKDDSVEWSAGLYRIWERDPSEGFPSLDEVMNYILPEDHAMIYDKINSVIATGEPCEFKYRIHLPTGVKHMQTYAKAVVDDSGIVTDVFGSVIDITEQVLTERRLRENEARLNEAQSLAKMGSYELDLVTNSIHYSSGAYLIYELNPDEPLPDPLEFQANIHPDDLVYFDTLWEELPNRRERFDTSFRYITPSGRLKYIHVVNQPERNDQDELVRVVGTIADITDLKLTEEALLRNEQRLNEAQELAKMGSFDVDLQTGNIEWSKGMYQIMEWEEKVEVSMEKFMKMMHPEDVHLVDVNFSDLSERREPWTIVYRVITKSGKVKFIEAFSKIVQSSDSIGTHLVGSCQDITEKKTIEEKLRLNEHRLFEAQELSKSGSWIIQLQPEYFLEWSPGTYKIWDQDLDEPAPSAEEFYSRILPADVDKVREAFRILIEEKRPAEVKYRIRSYEGVEKVFFSRGVPEPDLKGQVVKIYGTTADVSEREETERRLREKEQSLLQAQQIAKLGSWFLSLKDYSLEWTDGVYHIWERDLQLPSPTFDELKESMHPDDVEVFEEAIMFTIQSGLEQTVEFRIRMADRRLKTIEGRGRVVKDDTGAAVKIFGTVMDITERKRVEEELIRARTQAEDSSKAKEYFLANISHELRTPLNGILGMSRLLQKTALNTTQREYTEVLHSTAGNLLVIINDILDFAKIESGTVVLEDVDFDPARVADTAVQLQMFKAEEKDLTLRHLHEGPPFPKVIGDPYRLSQVLLNLLNNSIKYTNHGEVTLVHRILEETNESVRIQFTVSDTGIGIPYEMQQEIFESFTQVVSSDRKQGGIGLGLTISKSLVERQGGKIWVESKPDVGSSFHFFIPYQKATNVPEKKKSEEYEEMNLGSLKILLVEDNKVNLFITEAMLNDWGFKVDVAGNGLEAIQQLEKNDYDMVLMDIQMPEMNGLEATRVIRKMVNPLKAGVPIIAITANTSRQAHKQFIAEGMNDWVIKPFKDETLYKKIALHIKDKDRLGSNISKRKFPQRKRPVVMSEALYDLSSLKRDQPENKAFIRRMLTIFVESIPPIVDRMQLHFEKGEMEAVSTLAHKIKPTLDGVAIHSLKDVIRNIEGYRDKKRTSEQLREDLNILQRVITEVVKMFEVEIDSLDS